MPTRAEFFARLDAFEGEVRETFAERFEDTAREAMTRIIRRTPFKTGRAKASWRVGIDNADLSTAPIGYMASAGASEAISLATLDRLAALRENPYRRVFIGNNLPYAPGLEHGRSNQAPQGMVRLTAGELSLGIQGA